MKDADFFNAKDIKETYDLERLKKYKDRCYDCIVEINDNLHEDYKKQEADLEELKKTLDNDLDTLHNFGLLKKFRNNGRCIEDTYYNWARGAATAFFFKPLIAQILGHNPNDIKTLGADNLAEVNKLHNPTVFKRKATADFQVDNKCIEVQSGFVGENDIKKSKIKEANKRKASRNLSSILVHFDFCKMRIAFLDISNIPLSYNRKIKWKKNAKLNGVETTKIQDKYFTLDLTHSLKIQNPKIIAL